MTLPATRRCSRYSVQLLRHRLSSFLPQLPPAGFSFASSSLAPCRQVARGKVKKGRCESIALSKSGRVTYTGWDGDTGLVVADTYNPEAVQKKIVEQVRKSSSSVHGAACVSKAYKS